MLPQHRLPLRKASRRRLQSRKLRQTRLLPRHAQRQFGQQAEPTKQYNLLSPEPEADLSIYIRQDTFNEEIAVYASYLGKEIKQYAHQYAVVFWRQQ